MERRIIDITRTLAVDTAEWPGDQSFEQQWTERLDEGGRVNLSWFKMSPHLGTHADAPFHVDGTGSTSQEFDLAHFVGPAWVVDATGLEEGRIPADVLDSVKFGDGRENDLGCDSRMDFAKAPRVLLRTDSCPDRKTWNPEFASLSVELGERLVESGVRLVGIDTPGVDPAESQDLAVHHVLRRGGVTWLEGLDLRSVAPGLYDLVALPLKIAGGDASPVRAILMERAKGTATK